MDVAAPACAVVVVDAAEPRRVRLLNFLGKIRIVQVSSDNLDFQSLNET